MQVPAAPSSSDVDGPPGVHYACASNADCEGVWHGMTCGSAGFCVCPVASAGSGCSVARGRTTHGAAIGFFAVVGLLLRRRRAHLACSRS